MVFFRLLFAAGLLLAPGYFMARAGRIGAKIWLAFPLSLLALFWCIFCLHACGLRLTFGGVAAAEVALCVVLAWLSRKEQPTFAEPAAREPWRIWDVVFLGVAGITVLVLLCRSVQSPLAGWDTYFRWDFLAQQILKFGRYDFYPPRTPADFRHYFYVDAIPPMVSFTYWWLYAAAGAHWPKLTAIPVVLQYVSTLGLTYEVGKKLGGRRAGSFAAAALASSLLFLGSEAMGQETGLTALAMAGLLYATIDSSPMLSDCVVAGMMAALAALSREYGWAFLICGIVALAQTSRPGKRLATFVLASAILAGPWYVRTWWLTGNPFYSIPFLGMNVNPVLGGMLRYFRQEFGITTWTAASWGSMLGYLLLTGLVPWTIGSVGIVALFRGRKSRDVRIAWILIASSAVAIGLWAYSVGNSGGGVWYSTKVLSPAMVVFSIAAGAGFAWASRLAIAQLIWGYAIVTTLAGAGVYPFSALPMPAGQWMFSAMGSLAPQRVERAGVLLGQVGFPHSWKILSADAYLYVALRHDGYVVMPVWSPEVSFLFDPSVSAAEARRRLIGMGIRAVDFDPDSLNTPFLNRRSNFFLHLYHDPRGYHPLVHLDDWGILELPMARPAAD